MHQTAAVSVLTQSPESRDQLPQAEREDPTTVSEQTTQDRFQTYSQLLEESIFSTRIDEVVDKENKANLTTDLQEQTHFPLQLDKKDSVETR